MNVLAFFAHPDDETMLAGGTLALLAQAGAQVHYLCATRGEGGEMGEPALCTRPELGKFRENELVCAVRALGGKSLTFFDYIDPLVGPEEALFAYTGDLVMLSGQVAATIRQFSVKALITHGSNGEYGHPAHVLSHQAARLAVESFKSGGGFPVPRLYTTSANFPEHPRPRLVNQDDPADLVIDISPVLERKVQAALCHNTQHALFVRRASQEAGRTLTVPEVIFRLESLRRAVPQREPGEPDELFELLSPFSWHKVA
jgi:LmbE family N-acetylglucosaminyl deacetylase